MMDLEVIAEDGETGYYRLHQQPQDMGVEAGICPVPTPVRWYRLEVNNEDIDTYETFAEARAALDRYVQEHQD
jgi:hypothetical protein